MEIEIEPTAINGPGLLVKKGDKTLLHFPDPIRATVTTTDATIRLVVRIDQDKLRPVVDELHWVRREGGQPLSTDALRALKLGDILKQLAESTGTRWVLDEAREKWSLDPLHVHGYEAALAFKPSNRRAIPIGEVEQAAAVYRQAVDEGRRDATEAVRQALGTSRTSAARRIAKAREAGLLGKAVGTKAGER
jgi:hypothetical protein